MPMVYPIEIEIGEQRWSLLLAGKLSHAMPIKCFIIFSNP
jgi:hypothetical protein